MCHIWRCEEKGKGGGERRDLNDDRNVNGFITCFEAWKLVRVKSCIMEKQHVFLLLYFPGACSAFSLAFCELNLGANNFIGGVQTNEKLHRQRYRMCFWCKIFVIGLRMVVANTTYLLRLGNPWLLTGLSWRGWRVSLCGFTVSLMLTFAKCCQSVFN